MSPYNPHDSRVGKPGKPFDPTLTTSHTYTVSVKRPTDPIFYRRPNIPTHVVTAMLPGPNLPSHAVTALVAFALGVAVGAIAVLEGWA